VRSLAPALAVDPKGSARSDRGRPVARRRPPDRVDGVDGVRAVVPPAAIGDEPKLALLAKPADPAPKLPEKIPEPFAKLLDPAASA